MSRHLENLQRMLGELQSRYGADDPIVSVFHREAASCEAAESGFQELTPARQRGEPGSAARRRLDVASRYPDVQ